MNKHGIICDDTYDEWTKNWRAQEQNLKPYTFFKQGKQVQTGVKFKFESLRYLFSTPGVITIKIRFGLREHQDKGTPQQFHLILFGVDNLNHIVTPYYTSSAFTHHHHYVKEVEGKGNLPQELMKIWKECWREKVTEGAVGEPTFMLSQREGGFLRGYNYSLSEVMDALGGVQSARHIHIKFGLHEYYLPCEKSDSDLTPVYTFGLILYADTKAEGAAGTQAAGAALGDTTKVAAVKAEDDEVVDESGFYDFSAPCPHTC